MPKSRKRIIRLPEQELVTPPGLRFSPRGPLAPGDHVANPRKMLLEEILASEPVSNEPMRAVRGAYDEFAQERGHRRGPDYLTAPDANVKMAKSEKPTFGVTLMPDTQSGSVNACACSTAGCRAACFVNKTGKGALDTVQKARQTRTEFMSERPGMAKALILDEVERAKSGRVGNTGPRADRAMKYPKGIGLRPNVASDLRYEEAFPEILDMPHVQAYDYTKFPPMRDRRKALTDHNYNLTYSVGGPQSIRTAEEYLDAGGNATVVLDVPRNADMPKEFRGRPLSDADPSDWRPADKPGHWMGLRHKYKTLVERDAHRRTKFVFDPQTGNPATPARPGLPPTPDLPMFNDRRR